MKRTEVHGRNYIQRNGQSACLNSSGIFCSLLADGSGQNDREEEQQLEEVKGKAGKGHELQ